MVGHTHWDYTNEDVRQIVDKFVIVFVGAPRATSLHTWNRQLGQAWARSFYKPDEWRDDYWQDQRSLHGWQWGTDHAVPETHIICVTNPTDGVDRYLRGEDPRLAGLDIDPYMITDRSHPRYHQQQEQLMHLLYENWNDGDQLLRGKRQLNRDTWEQAQRENFKWATSVRFAYSDEQHDFMTRVNNQTGRISLRNTTWQNQFLHFIQAYNENKELFQSLTKNSVVIRIRYDMCWYWDLTLWEVARKLFVCYWGDRTKDPQHYTHHNNFDLSPLVMCKSMNIIRGNLAATDYYHAFDGPGACLFGEKYVDWLLDDVDRNRRVGHLPYDESIGPTEDNPFVIPEQSVPTFCMQHGYTIYDQELPSVMNSFMNPPLMDQWRYAWYDWTSDMVEELRQCN